MFYCLFKSTNHKQTKEIISLKARISELETEISKHLIKIGGLRDENDLKETEIVNSKNESSKIIHKLTTELNNLKNECMNLLKREREVKYISAKDKGCKFFLNFIFKKKKKYLNIRESIALKLGLDITMVSRQDFDMLSRIHNFINSIQNSHIHLHSICSRTFPCTQLSHCTYCH